MAGYTRQDTANNIANGNVIDADDFDAEYNAVENAFNASTGHKHDGTAGEGAPITKVGPSQDLIVSGSNVLPKTTNTLDLGSTGAQFKDAYFDGSVKGHTLQAGTNGRTTIVDNVYTVSSGGFTLDVAANIALDADGGEILLSDDGAVFGSFLNNSAQLIIKSGGTIAATFTGANVDLAGTLDVTGAATLDSTLDVTGAATLSGSVNIGPKTIDEHIQDTVGAMVTGNTESGISVTYEDSDGTLDFNVNDPTISLTGDVTGSATMTNLGNVSINTTVAANSVALGTDTTGNYVVSITGGTGVTVTGTAGEGWTPSIAIGQDVGTASDVTFNSVTSNLTGNANTATTLATARTIAGQSFDGSSNISIAPTDLTGVTSTATELNILDGVTATTAEINKLDGVTATTTELNYVDGVTSAIQTQLDRRLELISETVLSSNAADVTFTLPTGYRDFQLVLNNVKSSGNTTILYIEVSTDGGSTWIATSKYSSTGVRILDSSGSASTTTSTTTAGIIVATNNGSDQTPEIGGITYDFPTPGTSGVINIHNPHDTNQFTTFSGTTVNFTAGTGYDSAIGEPQVQIIGGVYGQKTAVNAINLSHKTGASVAAGAVVALYGMKDY